MTHKTTILAISLIAVTAVTANLEPFTGTWTLVAMYPNIVRDDKGCYSMTMTASKERCTCTDGKIIEVLEATSANPETMEKDGKVILPVLVVENVNDVVPSLNATCSCGGVEIPDRPIVRLVNDNYFVMYRNQEFAKDEVFGAVLFAREIRSRQAVVDDVKGIEDLRHRYGAVLCYSEIANGDLLSVKPRKQSASNLLFFP